MGGWLRRDCDGLDRRIRQDLIEGQREAAMPGDEGLDRRRVVIGDGAKATQFGKAADQVLSPGPTADHCNPNARG